jgi:hypothetical protein
LIKTSTEYSSIVIIINPAITLYSIPIQSPSIDRAKLLDVKVIFSVAWATNLVLPRHYVIHTPHRIAKSLFSLADILFLFLVLMGRWWLVHPIPSPKHLLFHFSLIPIHAHNMPCNLGIRLTLCELSVEQVYNHRLDLIHFSSPTIINMAPIERMPKTRGTQMSS